MTTRRTCLVVVSLSAASAAAAIVAWVYLKRSKGTGTNDSSDAAPKSSKNIQAPLENLPAHLQRELHKDQRRREKIPLLAMKSPMYDNILMTDPQGAVLSTIGTKKAKWYVNRELAKWTSDTTIQLLFEPKARSTSDDTYTITPKRNICVACGTDGHVMRHYVVPYVYRSLLPNKYKSHQSHDIVIMCPKCHLHCEQIYQEHMKEIEEELRTDPATAVLNQVDKHLYNVRSAAMALSRWKGKLPENKVEAYNTLVREHLGLVSGKNSGGDDDSLSSDQLQLAIDVEYRTPNPAYIPGAVLVVDTLDTHEKIRAFIVEWRTFFLETVEPRHLPHGWRLDASVACDENKVSTIQQEQLEGQQ